MTGYVRKVKNVSFADTEYEQGLLEYATKPEQGPFSVYIKRLIEQDRAGVAMAPRVVPATTVRPAPTQKDRNAALDML